MCKQTVPSLISNNRGAYRVSRAILCFRLKSPKRGHFWPPQKGRFWQPTRFSKKSKTSPFLPVKWTRGENRKKGRFWTKTGNSTFWKRAKSARAQKPSEKRVFFGVKNWISSTVLDGEFLKKTRKKRSKTPKRP
jgi:hypothetical protein